MSKQKFDFEVGKKYRGYGYLNEYGEFNFDPEKTGSRSGVIKNIATREGVSLSHSKNFLFVYLKIHKTKSICNYFSEITKKLDVVFKMLRTYEI